MSNKGIVTINGGEIKSDENMSVYSVGISSQDKSKLIFNNGTINIPHNYDTRSATAIYITGEAEIKNGNIYGNTNGVIVSSQGKLTINNGIISSYLTGLLNSSTAGVVVNGGEIKVSSNNPAIRNENNGFIVIKAGNISSINNSTIQNFSGTLNIEGGTYSSNNTVVLLRFLKP